MKKKYIIIAIVVIVVVYILIIPSRHTPINDYQGNIKDVSGNVVELVSGLHVRLIGVESGRSDVEMFIKNNFIGKDVTLYSDSSGDQDIESEDETVGAYVVLDENNWSINHLVINEYDDSYVPTEVPDSNWTIKKDTLVIKKDLALYMKQRTFLIRVQTTEGGKIGTGFFINENGLAITNWHVLSESEENYATAYLYQENPDDSKIYTDKKRKIKNVLWSENINGMDISIFSVDLENGEKVPYFNLAKRQATVGKNCATFGNPLGVYTASYSAGHISAFRDEDRQERIVKLMQYEMSTNGGNSGGPVCDDYGQIIAVHEAGIKTAQGINFGIDILQIREILDGLNFKYGGK